MISKELYQKLTATRARFESRLRAIERAATPEARVQCARQALYTAWHTGHGYYSSDVIEKVFTDVARSLKCPLEEHAEPDTCLIVLTVAYMTGGHTRVVERWIEEDSERRYSVALIGQASQPIPQRLIDAVKKSGGRLIVLDAGLSDVQKGLELRRISSRFESVVLHVHMDDVVPLIAYGTEDFKRPVGLYNHADHRFWLGLSITDLVADLRSWGRKITLEKRGIQESFLLTIPQDFREIVPKPKPFARRALGLAEDRKIVLTVGDYIKYRPMLGIDFLNLIRPLLEQRKDVEVIGIGMTMEDYPAWQRLSAECQGRLHAIGHVTHDRLYEYYFAADLVLDSRPTSGETALTDAVVCGCPVLAEMNPTGLMEWTINSPACCSSDEELVERAFRMLDDPGYAKSHVDAVRASLVKYNSRESFRRLLHEYYRALLSREHRIHAFKPRFSGFSDLDAYHYIMGYEVFMKVDLGPFFRKYTVEDGFTRRKMMEILGMTFTRRSVDLGGVQ